MSKVVKKKTPKKPVKKAPKKPVKKPVKKAPKKKAPKKKNLKTYVTFVLDKSGSMDSICDATINAFNEQVETIRKEAKGTTIAFSLTVFDHRVEHTFFNESIENVKLLSKDNYIPDGGTAMNDAIGLTISKMEAELTDLNDPNVAVLFVILTDGQENSSDKYNGIQIADTVKRLSITDRWTFSVVGANIDLKALAGRMNIPVGNMMKFAATPIGMAAAGVQSNQSYSNYIRSRNLVSSNQTYSTQGLYSSDDEVLDVSEADLSGSSIDLTNKSPSGSQK